MTKTTRIQNLPVVSVLSRGDTKIIIILFVVFVFSFLSSLLGAPVVGLYRLSVARTRKGKGSFGELPQGKEKMHRLPRTEGSVDRFFEGKNVFLTGCTGFLGKIVLEKLVRALPGIKRVFVLIRPKKDSTPEQRLHSEVLQSPLFGPLRDLLGEDWDSFISKVVAVKGDILEEELGMDPHMIQRVQEEVTVFIHCAATISFDEPLLDAINQNVIGTLRVLKLAKSCRRVDVFNHVSTAYVNSDRSGFIEEKIYPLPFDPEQMVENILSLSPQQAEKQTKKLLGRHPNTYTFTKSLCENILRNKRGNIPFVICRPSIITGSYKDPIPGWIDTFAAAGGLYAACGFGLLRFLPGNYENVTDQVPADFVSNCILVSCALCANKNKLSIFHVGTSHRQPLRWSTVKKNLLPYYLMNPPKRSMGKPSFQFITGPYPMYEMHYLFRWILPVTLYSAFAKTVGHPTHLKQAKLLQRLERRLSRFTETFRHFVENEWVFAVNNSDQLLAQMTPAEKAHYDFDSAKLDWTDYLLKYCYGLRTFTMKEKGLKPPTSADYVYTLPLQLHRRPFSDLTFAFKNQLVINNRNVRRTGEELKTIVFHSKRVQEAILKESLDTKKPLEKVQSRAREILDTMGAEASPAIMRSLGWAFRKIYRRLYSGVVINEIGMEGAKKLFAQKGPMVLIPTHRSYIDFLIVSYLFYSFDLPVPHIAAGDDFLNVTIVNWLFRHSGAFFMRRTFGGDELYRAIFTAYTQRLLLDGFPIEFFIEGTRSRSGKMLQPKLGLLSIITDTFFDGVAHTSPQSPGNKKGTRNMVEDQGPEVLTDIHFIPISISYEKVVEEHAHVKEMMGEGKKKPTLSGLLAAARWVLTADFGRINVQFGTPISLEQFSRDFLTAPQPADLSQNSLLSSTTSSALTTYIPSSSSSGAFTPPVPPSLYRSFTARAVAQKGAVDQVVKQTEKRNEEIVKEANRGSNVLVGVRAEHQLTAEVRRKIVLELAYKVCRELNKNNVCMSTGIIAALILAHRNGISLDELTERYDWLRNVIQEQGGWVDPVFHPTNFVVQRALKLLSPLVQQRNERVEASTPTFEAQRHWIHLGFYRNQLLHLFKDEGVVCLALASFGNEQTMTNVDEGGKFENPPGVSLNDLMHSIERLHQLFQFEFIPNEVQDYLSVISALNEKKVLTIQKEKGEEADESKWRIFVPPSGEHHYSFICSLFWPFVDSYWLFSLSLFSALPDRTLAEEQLIERAQWFGDRLYKDGTLHFFESNNKEVLKNAVYVFQEWKVIERAGARAGSHPSLMVRLAPQYRSEKKLEELSELLFKYRKRSSLSGGVTGFRRKMITEFPVLARF
ncbi:Dihydroxyacetone phosphate acyltransferase [Balamuthia mandrillaris]